MTYPDASVRGPGRSRGGATDTTMLIWKVIEANPGIDRAGIWEKVEHGIPEGYALRLYGVHRARRDSWGSDGSPHQLRRARLFVLGEALKGMRHAGSVRSEGDGSDRRYTVARELRYVGNPDAVDETGTRAAEHMAIINGRRSLENLLSRCDPTRTNGPIGTLRRSDYEPLVMLVKALYGKEEASE